MAKAHLAFGKVVFYGKLAYILQELTEHFEANIMIYNLSKEH
jgi:hypothetical protein